ncbi:Serine/threonine-protein kinase pelle [Papilio machaon]|uniref:non-specific serine/threonine protein kinase n=1 Tax=Papilio machaon TaxID=76193 RepID=A0A0N1PFR1_PAPMA|nr:Serine/threonine-protein kinase pelle [Papilio machaon]
MYIYELPFEVNKELCRLLDNDEEWKELAGVHMRYSPFDVNEIEREAKHKLSSPTAQLFIKWGQLNHRVEELFILLYRMKHVPALRCLVPVVDSRFHRLLSKHDITRSIKSKNADDGVWKQSAVAVKRLLNSDSSNNRELIGEMCLNQYRHDNILPLYGYSLGGPEACLVYQYMSGGSLEKRLRCRTGHPPLTWPQRYKIAHGVARGLQYLHTMEGTPLIHGDIKPGNILLDQCIMPKIGDFGLARKGPYGEDRTHMKVSRVHGTRPYLPDEYLRSHYLSPAVDVFSYGVVMLELATALPVMDRTRTVQLLRDYVIQLQNRPAFDLERQLLKYDEEYREMMEIMQKSEVILRKYEVILWKYEVY